MDSENALTIDVEDYFHVSAFAGSLPRSRWSTLPPRVERNTELLLAMLSARGVRATFFVLGWVAERFPFLVRRIAALGHEVACHGYSHRLIYNQTREVFRAETSAAKELLEDLAQVPVTGYRAASYSITRDSLWALEVLAELGFTYDSSVMPVVHDRYGIPGAEPWPHRIARGDRSLIEFPPTTISVLGARVPVAGGGYFRIFPYALTRAALRAVNRSGRPFIFYLHPWEIDPQQPRVAAPFLSRFRHYTNLHRTRPRLERLLDEFRFTTVAEVLARLNLDPASAKPAYAHG